MLACTVPQDKVSPLEDFPSPPGFLAAVKMLDFPSLSVQVVTRTIIGVILETGFIVFI